MMEMEGKRYAEINCSEEEGASTVGVETTSEEFALIYR